MKQRLFGCVALIALCASFAVVATRSVSASGEDKNTKALMAADDDWSKAAVAKNIDRVASFYAEDAVAYPPNEPVAVGHAAARKVWEQYFAVPSFQISWKATAAGAEKNTGWTTGTYEDSYAGPDGKTIAEKGKYLCVWRKGADGKWLAIRDMWNSDSK